MAVTVPAVLVIPVMVMPAGTLVAVTISVPAPSSTSLTVAMVELVLSPSCRVSGPPGVMDGLVLRVLPVKHRGADPVGVSPSGTRQKL